MKKFVKKAFLVWFFGLILMLGLCIFTLIIDIPSDWLDIVFSIHVLIGMFIFILAFIAWFKDIYKSFK